MASGVDIDPVTVSELSAELGVTPSRALSSALQRAASVQRSRRARGLSDRVGVTRSVLLWAICWTSRPVAGVLSGVGLETRALQDLLGIVGVTSVDEQGSGEADIVLEPELADVMRRHPQRSGEVGELDVARSLLESARTGSDAGLLGSRLRQLGMDVERGIQRLTELARDGEARTLRGCRMRSSRGA